MINTPGQQEAHMKKIRAAAAKLGMQETVHHGVFYFPDTKLSIDLTATDPEKIMIAVIKKALKDGAENQNQKIRKLLGVGG